MLVSLIINIILIPLNLALLPLRLVLKVLLFRNMSLWTTV
jgi:hypothetical protein